MHVGEGPGKITLEASHQENSCIYFHGIFAGKFDLHLSRDSLQPISVRPPNANYSGTKSGGSMGIQGTKEKAGVRVKLP